MSAIQDQPFQKTERRRRKTRVLCATKSACFNTFCAETMTGRIPLPRTSLQGLGKLVFIIVDAQVRQMQDFRCTAIVGFQLKYFAVGIALREMDDVLEICTAERINAL